MGNSKKLSVELKERSYEIIVGKDLIKTAGQKIEKTISGKEEKVKKYIQIRLVW